MLMRIAKYFFLHIMLLCTAMMASAAENSSETQQFYTPQKQMSIGVDLAQMKQDAFPIFNNYIGVSYTTYKSFYLFKPFRQRLKIGIDVAWVDLHYANYKINYHNVDGLELRYSYYTADIGVQIGLGLNVNLSPNWNLHARACYNPTLLGALQQMNIRGAFAHFGTAGLTLAYKHIGVGLGVRFGNPAYRKFDLGLLDEEDISNSEDSDIFGPLPGMASEQNIIRFKNFQLNVALIYTF
jgi:hypothetical protein